MGIPPGTPETAADAAFRRVNQDKLNRLRERMEEAAAFAELRPPDPPEVQAINRLIAESSWLASQNRLFSAARAASSHYSIVPLEPGGTTPILPASEGSRDLRKLLEWWQSYPAANVGVVVGRLGGVIALRVGSEGFDTLARLATVAYEDDDGARYEEVRDLGAAVVNIGKPGQLVSSTLNKRLGWGRQGQRAFMETMQAQRPSISVRYWIWTYPSEESGQDTREFKARSLGPDVALLGDDVIPFSGGLLDGTVIQAPPLLPPVVPTWFAERYGKPRRNLK